MSSNTYGDLPQEQDDEQLLEALAIKTSFLEKLKIMPDDDLRDVMTDIELELEERVNLKLL